MFNWSINLRASPRNIHGNCLDLFLSSPPLSVVLVTIKSLFCLVELSAKAGCGTVKVLGFLNRVMLVHVSCSIREKLF